MNTIAAQAEITPTPDARPSEPAPRSQTRTRLEVEQRRAQLLSLGQELFSSSTYDELSIDDIARAAGISKGLLYHYFPSKRDYYVETIRAAAGELLTQTDSAVDSVSVERLRAGIGAYLGYVERHKKAFAALLRSGTGHDPEVSSIVEGTRLAFLDRLLTKAPAHSPRVRNALRGWIGFVESSVLDWIDHNDVARHDLLELLVRALENIVLDASAQTPMSAGSSSS
jgi:AcrR family transcriptional regulator